MMTKHSKNRRPIEILLCKNWLAVLCTSGGDSVTISDCTGPSLQLCCVFCTRCFAYAVALGEAQT